MLELSASSIFISTVLTHFGNDLKSLGHIAWKLLGGKLLFSSKILM